MIFDEDQATCRNCEGGGWVCENHADLPWDGVSNSETACHCGGAGAPCGVCNLEAASAGYVYREVEQIVAWLRTHEGLGKRGFWLLVAADSIARWEYRDSDGSPQGEDGTASSETTARADEDGIAKRTSP